MSISRLCRACALFVCALLMFATGGLGQATRTIDAGSGLYAQQVFGRALIREPAGEVSELSLPPGTSLRRLESLETGWIAAGIVESPGTSDLFLLHNEKGLRRPFPTPQNQAGDPLRSDPVPLVENGQLVGLAWLAGLGVRETAVYASLWSGVDWAPAQLVSPPGPGTQIALAGTVLADGSWLLVWSAWDGNDDEIVWSRREEGSWSAPLPLHPANDRPDIVPTVVATGRGALAAWSSSDGATYRVRLAGFENGEWRELELRGSAGSVRPGLTATGDGALLLFRSVVPPSWTLYALDQRGVPLGRAVFEVETAFRPGLVPRAGTAPALEWPGAEVETPVRMEAEWRSLP